MYRRRGRTGRDQRTHRADGGLRLLPSTTFADCPKLDLVCVPGGAGMNPLLNDRETLDFLRGQAAGARYVTSVCTGALVLGAAGLLRGKRATTDWMSLPMLAAFGCEPVAERVVVNGNVQMVPPCRSRAFR